MPIAPPVASSGAREPERARPVPKRVRQAIELMVRGLPNDPDSKPLDFISAARACELKPDTLRRWLDRPAVRALLMAERRAWRDAICAGNEGALARVRNTSENGMAVIGAVRALEQIADAAPPSGEVRRQPGVVIIIGSPPDSRSVIDVTPIPPDHETEGGSVDNPFNPSKMR